MSEKISINVKPEPKFSKPATSLHRPTKFWGTDERLQFFKIVTLKSWKIELVVKTNSIVFISETFKNTMLQLRFTNSKTCPKWPDVVFKILDIVKLFYIVMDRAYLSEIQFLSISQKWVITSWISFCFKFIFYSFKNYLVGNWFFSGI